MRVKILNKYWTIRFVSYLGKDNWSSINQSKREILLLHSRRGKEFLDDLIHELIHAAGWHIDEWFVETLAGDLAREMRREELWHRITETPEP